MPGRMAAHRSNTQPPQALARYQTRDSHLTRRAKRTRATRAKGNNNAEDTQAGALQTRRHPALRDSLD